MTNLLADYLNRVCSATPTLPNGIDEWTSSIILRRGAQGTAIDYGFTGSARHVAIPYRDFFEQNGITLNSSVREDFERWRDIPIDVKGSDPRFGIDASRSLSTDDNMIYFGGMMKHELNWFIDDYNWSDLGVDPVEACKGGIKLGYDTALQRYTYIKTYTRFSRRDPFATDEPTEKPLFITETEGASFPVHRSSGTINFTFSIAEDNTLTLHDTQSCLHLAETYDADQIVDRWQDVWPTINQVKDDWEAQPTVCRMISTKQSERNNEDIDGGEAQNQGYFYFTISRPMEYYITNNLLDT